MGIKTEMSDHWVAPLQRNSHPDFWCLCSRIHSDICYSGVNLHVYRVGESKKMIHHSWTRTNQEFFSRWSLSLQIVLGAIAWQISL
jgi:hypothetical protein